MPKKTGIENSTKKAAASPAANTPAPLLATLDIEKMLERMSDAYLAVDAGGRVTYANAAAERTFGWRQQNLLGREIGNCLSKDFEPPLEQWLTRAMTEGLSVNQEVQYPSRGLWFEVNGYPDAKGFSIFFHDISALKRAQGTQREIEINLCRVQALARLGTWHLDAQRNELRWSDENYKIFGVPKGTPLKFEAFLATVQPDDRETVDRSWQAGPHGGFYELERRIVVGDATKWVRERAELEFDPQGRLVGGVGTTLDITDLKRAEQELLESRAQLASVIESAMDAVIAADAQQLIVVFNAAAEAMFHYPASEVIGKPLDMLIPRRFREAHAGHVRHFAATGVTSRAMGRLGTLSALRAGGEEFPIEASISQAEANRRQLFTVILRDITERRQAEERQRLLTAELDHRVKNVLANVSAVARMSSRNAQSVADFTEALEGRLQAMTAAHIMLQHGQWEGASLPDLIGEVLAPFRTHSGNVRMQGEPLAVTATATQALALVLQELATNAVKYGALSVPDGKVSVAWWRVDAAAKPEQVRLVWRESGGPPAALPPVKGFGLSLLQDMAALELGASVDCAFLPEGLEYTLEGPVALPGRAEGRATSASWLPRAAATAAAHSRRILIVEDEAMLALQLKALLESRGHSVVGPAASLKQALKIVREQEIDAALLDIRLTDGDSIPAAEVLLNRNIPFAFTTGLGPEALPAPLRSLPRLAKPYRDEDVHSLIAELLDA